MGETGGSGRGLSLDGFGKTMTFPNESRGFEATSQIQDQG
jgi:hypothetical protein